MKYKVRTRGSNGDIVVLAVDVELVNGKWVASRERWGSTPDYKRFTRPEDAVADLTKRANYPFLSAEPLQSVK